MLKSISKVEWSGLLFYEITGDLFSPNSVIVDVKDMHPISKDTAGGTTMRQFSSKLSDLYDDKEELEDMKYGSIHSHHKMGSFFSNTDMNDLFQDTYLYNPFVSLVVNNDEDYVAKLAFLTRKQVYNYHTNTYMSEGYENIYYDLSITKEVDTIDLNTHIRDMLEKGEDLNSLYEIDSLIEEFGTLPQVDDLVFKEAADNLAKQNMFPPHNGNSFQINTQRVGKYELDYNYTDHLEDTIYWKDSLDWTSVLPKLISDVSAIFSTKKLNSEDIIKEIKKKKNLKTLLKSEAVKLELAKIYKKYGSELYLMFVENIGRDPFDETEEAILDMFCEPIDYTEWTH